MGLPQVPRWDSKDTITGCDQQSQAGKKYPCIIIISILLVSLQTCHCPCAQGTGRRTHQAPASLEATSEGIPASQAVITFFFFSHNKRRKRQLRAGSFVDVPFAVGDTCLRRRSRLGMCVAAERNGEPGEAQARSPPTAQPPAHLSLVCATPAADRAAPLVNKCPLLPPELLQATHCRCPRPATCFLRLPHHFLGDLLPAPVSQGENPPLHRASHHPHARAQERPGEIHF